MNRSIPNEQQNCGNKEVRTISLEVIFLTVGSALDFCFVLDVSLMIR